MLNLFSNFTLFLDDTGISIFSSLKTLICSGCITVCSAFFNIAAYFYQVFIILANFNLFAPSDYEKIVLNIYIILGVIMLFVLGYNVLLFIIDPDKNSKGKEVEKILKNVITSLIMIVLAPYFFNFMGKVQMAVIKQDTIGEFFRTSAVGDAEDFAGTNNTTSSGYSSRVAVLDIGVNMFSSMFSADEGFEGGDDELKNYSGVNDVKWDNVVVKDGEDPTTVDCSLEEKSWFTGWFSAGDGKCTLTEAKAAAKEYHTFKPFQAFAKNVALGHVNFASSFFVTFAASLFLAYCFINYALDMGIRVFKLVFYQIIAPIPILFRIIPNKGDVFKRWMGSYTKTYMDVFIRIFAINLTMFMIQIVTSRFFSGKLLSNVCKDDSCGKFTEALVYVALILGLLFFLQNLTSLISELFGIENSKLGLKDRVSKSLSGIKNAVGVLGAGVAGASMAGRKAAMAGGKAYNGVRAGVNGVRNGWKNGRNVAKAQNGSRIWHATRAVGGAVSGGFRSIGSYAYNQTAMPKYISGLQDTFNKDKNIADQALKSVNISQSQHLGNVRQNMAYKNADGEVKRINGMIENNETYSNIRKLKAQEVELDGKVRGFKAELDDIDQRLAQDNLSVADRNGLVSYRDQIAKNYNDTKTELDGVVGKLKDIGDVEIKNYEQLAANLSASQSVIDSYKENKRQKEEERKAVRQQALTGEDPQKISQALSDYNKQITNSVAEVISKNNDRIKCSMSDSLSKIDAFKDTEMGNALKSYFTDVTGDNKAVIDRQVSMILQARSIEDLNKVMGADTVNNLGIKEQNFAEFQENISKAYNVEYQKAVVNAVADALAFNNQNNTFDVNGEDFAKIKTSSEGQTVITNINNYNTAAVQLTSGLTEDEYSRKSKDGYDNAGLPTDAASRKEFNDFLDERSENLASYRQKQENQGKINNIYGVKDKKDK